MTFPRARLPARADRAGVPAEIARSSQFASVCCASAACLVRVLDGA